MMSTIASRPWLDGRVPNGFWNERKNRIQYMNWLGQLLGFQHPEDWYNVRKSHFKTNRGGGLLCTQYGDSAYAAVREFMPQHEWLPWRFQTVPANFWSVPENRHRYMGWLGAQLGFTCPDDWYGVVKQTFANNCGAGLLHGEFGDSVLACLRDFMPNHKWLPWKFKESPKRYWHNPANRRAYMSWLGSQLGFVLPSDWYGITKASFYANHGAGLLRSYYDDSPQRAVREILPEMDWKPWLFTSVPQRFWHEVGNRLDYLKWLGQQLSLRNPDDWLRLSSQQLRQHCGASLLEFYESGAARLDSTNAVACTQHKAKAWSLIVRVECTLNGHDPQTLFTELA